VSRLRGRGPILMGDSIEVPSGCAPRRAALSSARQECWSSSDAFVNVSSAPKCELTLRRGAPRCLVKETASCRVRAPSIYECSLDAPLAREISNASPPLDAGFAAVVQLPTLLRLTAFVGQEARPSRLRGFITRARSRPRAARRLLPSIRSASTVVGPSIPTVRQSRAFARAAARLVCGGSSCTLA